VGWVNVQFTLPRGDFSAVPFVETPVTTGLVIQNQPNVAVLGQGGGGVIETSAPGQAITTRLWGVSVLGGDFRDAPSDHGRNLLVAMGENRGVIFPLVGSMFNEGRLWYQFNIPNVGNGWDEAHLLFLRPLICPGAQASAVVLKQTVTPGSGPDASPGTGFPVSGGQEAYAVGAAQGMVKIELAGGANGWVPIDATAGRDETKLNNVCPPEFNAAISGQPQLGGTPVFGGTPAPASLAAPRVVVNTAFLNIRSGPGAQFTAVATVSGGTELPVIGLASDKVWYLVVGPFGQGWVNNEFLLFRGDISNVPIIRNAVGTLASPTATIVNAVVLYAAPNTALGTVGALSGPVNVPVVARTSDFQWVQLNTSIGFGWVPASQVNIQGDTSLIPVVAQ
jgi:uncharacterized protein YraI